MTAQLKIEELLKQRTGIDAASLGSTTVERAIRERMARCHSKDVLEYRTHLELSETEFSEFVERIVVPETWFFRDREPFAALGRFALGEWLPANATGKLRLLSAPCATGEEPYSMAMALLDAGFSPDRFHIDGVDISSEALDHAKKASYSQNSFRGKPLDFRDRYFDVIPDGHRVREIVRDPIHFQKANLAEPCFLVGNERYDVIFCRNVLIYFDTPAQEQVIEHLARLLTPAGILFVGHSEMGLFVETPFASARLPMAFAYRKALSILRKEACPKLTPNNRFDGSAISKSVGANSRVPGGFGAPARNVSQNPSTAKAERPEERLSGNAVHAQPILAVEPRLTPPCDLDQATFLAGAGRLEEAARLCHAHLQKHGPSAAAYYLFGVVQETRGDKQLACEYYRKAIYLDPDNYETLLHLALLTDELGEPHDGLQWHNRARRVKERAKA